MSDNQPTDGLDRNRVEAIAFSILKSVRANYVAGPESRDRVFEALNALAFCVAVVVRGSDADEALEWFSKALNIALTQGDFPTNQPKI